VNGFTCTQSCGFFDVGVGDGVGVGLLVGVGVGVGVGVLVGVGVGVGVALASGVGLLVGVGSGVGVEVAATVAVGVGVGVADADGAADAEAAADADGDELCRKTAAVKVMAPCCVRRWNALAVAAGRVAHGPADAAAEPTRAFWYTRRTAGWEALLPRMISPSRMPKRVTP